jgi:hypothetical protein
MSRKNWDMFQKLCGERALQNVVIVTNMLGDDPLFKSALDKGSIIARHDETLPSAQKIIHRFLHNHPLPLRIQEELVDEGKDLSHTGAGEQLNRELNTIRARSRPLEITIASVLHCIPLGHVCYLRASHI